MRVRPPPPRRAAHCRSSGRVHARTHARTPRHHCHPPPPTQASEMHEHISMLCERKNGAVGRSVDRTSEALGRCLLTCLLCYILLKARARATECRLSTERGGGALVPKVSYTDDEYGRNEYFSRFVHCRPVGSCDTGVGVRVRVRVRGPYNPKTAISDCRHC